MAAKNSNHSLFVLFLHLAAIAWKYYNKDIFYMFNTYICLTIFYFIFLILEPKTQVVGEPDIFVDIGSMLNLSCVVSYTERPPIHVQWLHNGIEVSFRGPRNGVSVSLMYLVHTVSDQKKISILKLFFSLFT